MGRIMESCLHVVIPQVDSPPVTPGGMDEPNCEKPAIPYTPGAQFTIYPHTTPSRTPEGYAAYSCEDMAEIQLYTPLQRCLRHPPSPSTRPSNSTPPTTILITDQIAVRDGRGAQIVVINDEIVAKIYDPLYYPLPALHNDVPRDPIRAAEEDFTHEATAYERINSKLGGSIVPEYYGSFTLELPIPASTPEFSPLETRHVHLILMELVPGDSMRDTDHIRSQFPQAVRKAIMEAVVDGESALYACGITQLDLHPRNFILCHDEETDEIRVVLIDFERTEATPPEDCVALSAECAEGPKSKAYPVSPLLRWDARQDLHEDFEDYGWIDWDWQSWLEKKWTGSASYAPVSARLEDEWLGIFKEPIARITSVGSRDSYSY